MNISASPYQNISTSSRQAMPAPTGQASEPSQGQAIPSGAVPEETFTPSSYRVDPGVRLRLAARNALLGSAPVLGAFTHIAAGLGCSKGGCGPVKDNLNAAGLLANVAGTVALGAAAVFGGGPVFGAVTGVLLGASALSAAYVLDQK